MWNWRRRSDDFAEEISAHISHETKRLVEDEGMSFKDAKAQALRLFGNVTRTQERFYEGRRSIWLDDFQRDVTYAVRSLRRSPAFALIAILTLSLGIGANTAIFSVVNTVLLKPLPYPDADRFVRLQWEVPAEFSPSRGPIRNQASVSAVELRELQSRVKTLSHIGTVGPTLMALAGREELPRLQGVRVSTALFQMLGVTPLHGRLLERTDEAPDAERAVLISYGTWQRHFGGTPDIVGRVIEMETVLGARRRISYTVRGVMPRGFEFPDSQTQFWMAPNPVTTANSRARAPLIGRLADGISGEAASDEVGSMLRHMRSDERAGANATYTFAPVEDSLVVAVKPALIMLVVAVAVVLLIACINVANLLLARGTGRHREMAIRAAIGAGRGRLIRQTLAESLVLALAGAAAGIGLAFAGIRLLRALATTMARIDVTIGQGFPRLDDITIDFRVLWFTLAIAMATGLLFGLPPALRQSRPAKPTVLKDESPLSDLGTRSTVRSGARNLLVVAEIGMAMVLLACGGLLMHSFVKLSSIDPGFDPKRVLTFQISLPLDRYADDVSLERFADSVTERLSSLPGVQAAAYGRQLPLVQLHEGYHFRRTAVLPDAAAIMASDLRLVSRDYLTVMGMRIMAGRGFDDRNVQGQPRAVLINEALAARYFAGENPVGQSIYLGRESAPWQIVGVVRNVRQLGLDKEPEPQLFADFDQWSEKDIPRFPLGPYFALRTGRDPMTVITMVRQLVRDVDPSATLFNTASMEQLVATTIARQRMYAVLLGIFAAVGMTLAVIGIYGVMAYSVTQRTREIGIRMALGARRAGVMRLMMRQSLVLTGVGIALGLSGAAAVTRYLEGMLFGLTPLDPVTFIVVALVFAAVATIAALIPAQRAIRIDPLRALRYE